MQLPPADAQRQETHSSAAATATIPSLPSDPAHADDGLIKAELVQAAPTRKAVPVARDARSASTNLNRSTPPPASETPLIIEIAEDHSFDMVDLSDFTSSDAVAAPLNGAPQYASSVAAPINAAGTSTAGSAKSTRPAPTATAKSPRVAPAPLADGLTQAAVKILMIYGGSSLVVGFLSAILLSMFFMSGSSQPASTIAAADTASETNSSSSASVAPAVNETARSAQPTSNAAVPMLSAQPTTTPSSSPESSSKAPNTESSAASTTPLSTPKPGLKPDTKPDIKPSPQPEAPKSPFDLKPIAIAEPVKAFTVPFNVVTSLYDESQGQTILPHPEEGLLVYKTDDLLAGNGAPTRIVSLGGERPVAMCRKTIGGQPLLFVATEHNHRVHVFDATLNAQPPLVLPGATSIVDLSSSQFDKDSRLYFCDVVAANNNSVLCYYDFQTKEVKRESEIVCGMVNVSPDGRWLSCYNRGTSELYRRMGNKLVSANFRFNDIENGQFTKDRFIYHEKICTSDGAITLQTVPGRNYTEFTKKPLGICWSPGMLCVVSSNNYRVLAQVKLDESWKKYYNVSPQPGLYQYRFVQCDLHADETRQAALGRIRQTLFVANLAGLNLPSEPDLRPANNISDSLPVGQTLISNLGLPPGVEVRPVQSSGGLLWTEDSSQASIAGGSGRMTALPPLHSDVTAQANMLYFKGENFPTPALPFKIRLNDELMVVTRVELTEVSLPEHSAVMCRTMFVSRTDPKDHPANSLAEIVNERAPSIDPAHVPMTKVDKLAWRPAPGTMGVRYVRLIARLQGASREILQRVDVTLPKQELPIVIHGLSVDRDNEMALVWGRENNEATARAKWKAILIDLTGKSEQRSIDVPKTIIAGCLDKRAFYLATENQDRPKPVYVDQSYWSGAERPEIQSYDIAKMTPLKKTTAPERVKTMESLAGKYLVINKTLPMTIPDFKAQSETDRHNRMLHGRVGDGWLYEGVLYDKDLVKPKLLIQPPFLSRLEMRPSISTEGSNLFSSERLGGPQYQLINEQSFPTEDIGAPLSRFAGGVRIDGGWLRFNAWPPSNNQGAYNAQYTLAQVNLCKSRYDGGLHWLQGYNLPIAASNENFIAGYWNELWIAPLKHVLPKVASFQLPQEQDKFVLNAHKSNTLTFSTENAVRYDLAFYMPFNSTPMLVLQSDTGKFEFQLDEQPLVDYAINEIKRLASQTRAATPMDSRPYEKMIAEATEAYAGKKISGVGVPVYACVMAHHQDGKQRCALTHFYMVDVATNVISKASRSGATPGTIRRP